MQWINDRLIFCLLILSSSALFAKEETKDAKLEIKFPSVSTILQNSTTEKIHDFVRQNNNDKICYHVQGYFSVAEGSWNYRIIGRARVLEIYRLLVLAGVNPNAIRMSSLGPLDERREYLGKPPGTIVNISSHSANELNCKAIQSASSDQKLHADLPAKDELTLDYLILDGDPKASDLQSYRDQIRMHKAIQAETMHIISYADSPGSRYLNKVLSRLRALVLFRIATLEGYRPDAIDLSWQGEVTREEPGNPAPIVQFQRRTIVRFSSKLSNQEKIAEQPAPKPEVLAEAAASDNASLNETSPDSWNVPTGWSLGVFSGLTSPPSSINPDLKTAMIYGIALRIQTPSWHPGLALESLYSRQYHARTKADGVVGHVGIKSIRLGFEYEFAKWMSGQALVHGGLIQHSWSGAATYQPNGENHQDSGSDFGAYTALGDRFDLFEQFYTEPRIELNAAHSTLQGWMTQFVIEFGRRF